MTDHSATRIGAAQILAFTLWIGLATDAFGQSPDATPGSGVQVTFPPGEYVVAVPMLGDTERPVIAVAVNGGEPAPFALDSGTFGSLWLGNQAPGPAVSPRVRMKMGSLEVAGASLGRVDGGPLGDLPFQGILGTEVFAGLVVELDWRNRIVRFHDPATFEAPPGTQAVGLEARGGHVLARATVEVEGRRSEADLLVDTGAGYALSLRSASIPPPRGLTPDVPIGRGLHGAITASVGRVERLALGGMAIADVETFFVDSDSYIVPPGLAGGIGTEVLMRFGVYLDISGRRMLLRSLAATH